LAKKTNIMAFFLPGDIFGQMAAMDSALRRGLLGAGGFGALPAPPGGGGGGGGGEGAGAPSSALAPWASPLPPGLQHLAAATSAAVPALDIHEHGDHYELTCDCPGLHEDEVELSLSADGRLLSISARPHAHSVRVKDKATGRVVRRERWSSSWSRTLVLPEDALTGQEEEGAGGDGIRASLDRGVLKITVSRRNTKEEPEAAAGGRAAKRIAITPAAAAGAGGGGRDKPQAAEAAAAANGGGGKKK
jgi:HSP20 family protein